jgi:DNA replication and repair protein RecF
VHVAWIEVRDFRNHQEVSLELSPGVTAVVGPNGRGKTNLLEAIYYLCWLVSPRVSSDLPLVRSGATSAFLRGEVQTPTGRFLVEVEVRSGGQNRVQVNRNAVRRKRDLRRDVRAVFSGPDDLAVVLGDPGERRRFMDETVTSLWPPKDGAPAAYERVVRQRNRLLKEWGGSGAPPDLEAWDSELVAHGVALSMLRRRAVDAVARRAGDGFRLLSGHGEDALVVQYRPSVELDPGWDQEDAQAVGDAFQRRLAERRGDELVRRTTLVGPHRDDLGLTVEGLAARGFASHGEAWGAALSLRLAQAQAVERELASSPVLLLDDPFSGLDPDRRRRLAGGLPGRGQVLLAVPEEAHIPPDAGVLCVEEGRVVPG